MSEISEDATTKPNWELIEREVVQKIRLLRAAWEYTAKAIPKELHEAIEKDLYCPALSHLANFCACVEFEVAGCMVDWIKHKEWSEEEFARDEVPGK